MGCPFVFDHSVICDAGMMVFSPGNFLKTRQRRRFAS
jgi:hypothetical protein